jgi:hypothetical protein
VRATLAALLLLTPLARAGDVEASEPAARSVTIYRAPWSEDRELDLDDLGGLALVSETRTVHIPAGLSRLRFTGVSDGIVAASAILSGLPPGLIERNRDSNLISPDALLAATVGRRVVLRRTNPKSGQVELVSGTLQADTAGVVFQTAAGVEALHCSHLPEILLFEPQDSLSAKPTLSVLLHSDAEITAEVQLSYLAEGFDWAATYTANISEDGRHLDLGAWVTLANGNGTSFPDAQTQVVAGRVNRLEDEERELPVPFVHATGIECWEEGSTSSVPPAAMMLGMPALARDKREVTRFANEDLQEIVVTGARQVSQEQLGDLKLYRVPDLTTVAARQSKQVRLLDKFEVPFQTLYGYTLDGPRTAEAALDLPPEPAHRLALTENTKPKHLGLPLPSGSLSAYQRTEAGPILVADVHFEDHAEGEEVEIDLGESPDVTVTHHFEARKVRLGSALKAFFSSHLSLRELTWAARTRVDISNALPHAIDFEYSLALPTGLELAQADQPLVRRKGRPTMRLHIPANATRKLSFQLLERETIPVPE